MKNTAEYTVELTNFAGPLDLLLSLIERRELEITEVAVGQVTADYLRTVSALETTDEQELMWFLDIATQLLHYKSRALRVQPDLEDEAEGDSNLADLTEQLVRLQAIRQMARLMAAEWGSSWENLGDRTLWAHLPPRNLTLDSLNEAWLNLRSRQSDRAHLPTHQVTITKLDIATASQRLLERLQQHGRLSIAGMATDRRGRVEQLLAVLELVKQELIEVLQEGELWHAEALR